MSSKILVVDDERALRENIADLLNAENFKCIEAENGQKALDYIMSAEGKDIVTIISDIKMPVMDGLTLIKNLREKGIEVPFIFITGFGDKEKAVEALKWGAMDFIDKPFKSDVLMAAVDRASTLGEKLVYIETHIASFFEKVLISKEIIAAEQQELISLITNKAKFKL